MEGIRRFFYHCDKFLLDAQKMSEQPNQKQKCTRDTNRVNTSIHRVKLFMICKDRHSMDVWAWE